MTIYYELIRRVESGESFSIDFKNRNMKVGKQFLIKNGKFDESKHLMVMDKDLNGLNDILDHIEDIYQFYKFSIPSERNDRKQKKYFKALSVNELTDEQLMVAGRREVEQARLEGFILCTIVNGKFKWDEDKLGSWFWQSKNDPDLIILRNWIENN